jgi:hypothetical protein
MLGLTTTSLGGRPFSRRPRQPRGCTRHAAAAAAAVHTSRQPLHTRQTGSSSRSSRSSRSSVLQALGSSSSSGGDADTAAAASPPGRRPVTKQQLTAQLEAAVAEERYSEAAMLRDQIRAMEEQDPATRAAAQLARLQEQLDAAVAAEDYAVRACWVCGVVQAQGTRDARRAYSHLCDGSCWEWAQVRATRVRANLAPRWSRLNTHTHTTLCGATQTHRPPQRCATRCGRTRRRTGRSRQTWRACRPAATP